MSEPHHERDAWAPGAHALHAPKHPYHLVDPSPWPIVGAIAAGSLTGGGVLFMHGDGWPLMIVGFLVRARRSWRCGGAT